ncbi:unnamed protein product, partial [Didymodactylos carnosus]
MGIQSDGSLFTWGSNAAGQLGNGSNTDVKTPTQLGKDAWSDIGAGADMQMAIKSDGTLWGWGLNNGQLGNGTDTPLTVPTRAGNP